MLADGCWSWAAATRRWKRRRRSPPRCPGDLSYRGRELSRPKPENVARLSDASVELRLATTVREVRPDDVVLRHESGAEETLANDVVFAMIGRGPARNSSGARASRSAAMDAPLARGPASPPSFSPVRSSTTGKRGRPQSQLFQQNGWFPYNIAEAASGASALATAASAHVSCRRGSITRSPTTAILCFGVARCVAATHALRDAQTAALAAFQVLPLFLLPYVLLPWAGHGLVRRGFRPPFADAFFPLASYGQGREYWRAFGFVLAWPLFIWNFFTAKPMWAWLAVGISVPDVRDHPWMVRRWGKGAYCGWICSCGALARRWGDLHRGKMPHGPLEPPESRRAGCSPSRARSSWRASRAMRAFGKRRRSRAAVSTTAVSNATVLGVVHLDYYHVVGVFLAGIVGVGCYFWFSGRVWCRFACPLAALMHVYARFSSSGSSPTRRSASRATCAPRCVTRGIDVMSFANRGARWRTPNA